MPKYHVERSIVIDVPKEKALNTLKTYTEWIPWSPWLFMDKRAEISFSDNQGEVGSSYLWIGEFVGTGSMKLVNILENQLEMKLKFFEPFKSEADVFFSFESEGENSIKVTWKLFSAIPFFLFFMTKQIEALTCLDYDRGLKMLKEYLETGKVTSKVMMEGTMNVPIQRYIGIKRTSKLEDIQEVMKKDFETLYAFMERYKIKEKDVPFSIYNTFDISKQESEFISCIPYTGNAPLPKESSRGELPSFVGLKVTHKGSYQHLGNAWSTAFTYTRTKKIKTTDTPVGVEFYMNNPSTTEEKDLITEIYLPLK